MISVNSPITLTAEQRLRLQIALSREKAHYDPSERMVRVPFSSPGYHTTLKGGWVHPTRESLIYAVSLMDSEDVADQEIALGIIDRVLDLQDIDPASKTYGIWSWFLEEPLAQMSPPDWNWTDFCGAQLLETTLTHGALQPYPLSDRIRNGIIHAARSIERRNVHPGYTNIAIMGTFVVLAAAEVFDLRDLHAYGLARLRRFHAYTREQGGFTEYNSPTYTLVALDELSRILRHVQDSDVQQMASELYRTAWAEIANHFHAPTRQWAGPHSRAYQTLLENRVRGLLHRATGGRFPGADVEPEINEHRFAHVCPPDVEAQFFSLEEPREFRQVFIRGSAGVPNSIGTTCLAPAFSLGSINAGDMWNQRRPLVIYWGTHAKPSALRLRFMRDGYDFSAAFLFSAQRQGDLVGGVGFALDGASTHIFFDKIQNGTIKARDLRLRFEIEGAAVDQIPAAPAHLRDAWTFTDGEFSIAVSVAYAAWGKTEARWEKGAGEGKSWLDVVLYSGREKEFKLGELAEATCAFAVRCSAGPVKPATPQISRDRDQLVIAAEGLEIRYSARPTVQTRLLSAFKSSIA
jgi:hypothetical protein